MVKREEFEQLKLDLIFEDSFKRLPRKVKKRIRYKIPTYIKFYSIYQYDRLLFRELMNEWLKTKDGMNRSYKTLTEKQNQILEVCYVRDKNGKPLRDCDERHIYRYATLQKICESLYNLGQEAREISCLSFFDDEKQAEIKNTWQMSVYERVKIHLRLLRRIYERENL